MTSSLLDKVKIASPCDESWDLMDGDNRTRFCAACSKSVYNISDMSEQEASEFLANRLQSICIRLFRRKDGTVITDDCPVGLRRLRNKFRLFKRMVGGILASLLSSMPAWAQAENFMPSGVNPPVDSGTVDMGGLAPSEGTETEEITDRLKTDKSKKREWKKAAKKKKKDFDKAVLYQSIGEQDKAIRHFEKALDKNKSDASLYLILAKLLEKRGKKADIARACSLRDQARKIKVGKQTFGISHLAI